MMLEQKDLIIQQLQKQIEELEQKSSKEENQTINQLVQENAALKQKLSELDQSESAPIDLTGNPEVQMEEEIIKVNE
ncbi:hypothetical protein H8356DRAFT_267038 [Neocallimastix lanati (nom. inval.)]|nr:hypothetical protein H8356DRAFT_267038 [Neocallimastix sp. JGI-2020a]